MACVSIDQFGWQLDLPDHRDFALSAAPVAALLRKLKLKPRKSRPLPEAVDWREYCGPVEDQQGLGTSSAHACAALIQQFERRASGRFIRPSRLFIDYTARRLAGDASGAPVSLRTVFKAVSRCGVPPERHWPFDATHASREPDAFAYGFQREFRALRYLRLDSRGSQERATLDVVRSFLAAGFFVAFGFSVSTAVTVEPEIPFPTAADSILGGQAVTAVGYDDKARIRSDKGAILVRNSWGRDWGDRGFGWLPYAFVRERLACDFWTLFGPRWLRSGEFDLPAMGA
jgi:C1A family cysteine protease